MKNTGRAGGIRTRGLFVPNEALYQAEPQPDVELAISQRGNALIQAGGRVVHRFLKSGLAKTMVNGLWQWVEKFEAPHFERAILNSRPADLGALSPSTTERPLANAAFRSRLLCRRLCRTLRFHVNRMLLASLVPTLAWFSIGLLATFLEIKLIILEQKQKARLRQVHGFIILFILACFYGSYHTMQTRNWDGLEAMAESIWKEKPAGLPIVIQMDRQKGAWIFYYVGKEMKYLKEMDALPKRPRDTMRLVDSSVDVSSKNLSTIVYFDLVPGNSKTYIIPKDPEPLTLTSLTLDAVVYDAKSSRWLGRKSFDPPALPQELRARDTSVLKTPILDDVRRWATKGE